jgi:hypothetical protein
VLLLIDTANGSFRTKGTSEGTEDIDFIGEKENVHKFLRDGQIYLMYEGRMYDVRGQLIIEN